MALAQRIGDRLPDALPAQLGEARADRIGTPVDRGMRHQPDRPPALPLQHRDQVAVGHRGQRVMAHVGVGEQLVADEQVALIDGAAVLRQGRAGDREVGAQRLQQRLADRADVAAVGRIEGRAVFEQDLLGALGAQPFERGERLADRGAGLDGARLERDHHRLGVARIDRRLRHADQLHGRHALAHQHAREVGGPGEVVGDAAKQERHGQAAGL